MPDLQDDPSPSNWFKAKVSNWFWSLTPTCREVARLTSEEREHPLPLSMRLRLGLHRSFCKWCARYAKQIDLLHEASHLFPEHLDEAGGPAMNDGVKARLKSALQQQQAEGK